MRGVTLILLLINLPSTIASCFTHSPWVNVRPLLRLVNPCLTIDECESYCLANSQCSAYSFVNAQCALLGADSGNLLICISANPTLSIRTAACDITSTSTITTPSTTSTTTPSSTTSTSTTTTSTSASTTTNPTASSPCGPLNFEVPVGCGTCSIPTFNGNLYNCGSAKYWVDGVVTGVVNIMCFGSTWMPSPVVTGSTIYCKL